MYDLILIAAAVIPAVFLMVKVYQADRLEKEPIGMLIGLMILGIISTSLAGITEELGDLALTELFPSGGLLCDALLYFVVVLISCFIVPVAISHSARCGVFRSNIQLLYLHMNY